MAEKPRTLTVMCASGLANRLRVLLSGAALAEATGRRFEMYWPRTSACSADFDGLFTAPWAVRAVEWESHRLPNFVTDASMVPDLLTSDVRDLAFLHTGTFFAPEQHPHHGPHVARSHALLDHVQPIDRLARRIHAFADGRFRPVMIGVHLRRGDFVRRQPDLVANAGQAVAAVTRMVDAQPDAGILLCTDDGGVDQESGRTVFDGVRELFVSRFGSRVVIPEARSLDRRDPVAIEDAVVHLWLLRQTQYVVGSAGSSFSELAVVGRDVPAEFCGGPTAEYARFVRAAQRFGLERVLRSLPTSRRFGADASLASIWAYYRSLPPAAVRRVRRLLQGDTSRTPPGTSSDVR